MSNIKGMLFNFLYDFIMYASILKQLLYLSRFGT